jgi:hypothetical protein
LLTSVLRTSQALFQAYELHIRKPSFVVGNDTRYTQRIFGQLGLPKEDYDAILAGMEHLREAMNLGAWVGPKESVSAEQLSGRETEDFDRELRARGELVTRLMRRTAEREGRARWGFKILGDVVHADRYAAVWPNATFILMVRDPRDHALSVIKLNLQRAERNQPNFYDDYAAVARGWRETIQRGAHVLEANGLRHIVVRYEDLVGEPERELHRLSETLDIDLSRGLDFHREEFVESQIRRFKHHGNLKNPINAASVGKWREQMSDKEVEVFASLAGDVMADYGYALSRTD